MTIELPKSTPASDAARGANIVTDDLLANGCVSFRERDDAIVISVDVRAFCGFCPSCSNPSSVVVRKEGEDVYIACTSDGCNFREIVDRRHIKARSH